MTPPFLRLSGVTRRYHGQGGIDDVSLTVSAGESVVLVGPSGSGKTTLLRLVAGLERPDAGEIWLDGRTVAEPRRNTVPAHQRRVGFVFQDLALWPHLTVFGNVDFAARSAVWRWRNAHRRSMTPFDCAESIRCWPVATLTSSQVENNSASRSHARW